MMMHGGRGGGPAQALHKGDTAQNFKKTMRKLAAYLAAYKV